MSWAYRALLSGLALAVATQVFAQPALLGVPVYVDLATASVAAPPAQQLTLRDAGLYSWPKPLSELTQLRYLNLMGNALERLDPAVSGFAGLQTLNLRANNLHYLDTLLFGLDSLVWLDVSENALQELVLGPLSVTYLAANYNELVSVEVTSSKFWRKLKPAGPALQELSLRGNYLSDLPCSMAELIQLRSLDLSYNQFRALDDCFFELVGLSSLNLSYNALTVLSADLAKLSQLEALLLSSNKLRELPTELTALEHLELLVLADNELITLPQNLHRLTALRTLVLTGNPLAQGEKARIEAALPNCQVIF